MTQIALLILSCAIIVFSGCSEKDSLGDLRTPGQNDGTPSIEQAQTIESSSFKANTVYSSSNYSESQLWNKLQEQWRPNCKDPEKINPDFKVGDFQVKQLSRTVRGDHYSLNYLASNKEINTSTTKIIQEIKPTKVVIKNFTGNAFAKSSEFAAGKLTYLFETNAELNQISIDFYNTLLNQLQPNVKNRIVNTLRTVFQNSQKDPRLCSFATSSEELSRLAVGEALVGSTRVKAYHATTIRNGELNCGNNRKFLVEIRDQQVRSLRSASPEASSYCDGGLLTHVQTYSLINEKPYQKMALLVDREDLLDGTLLKENSEAP